MIRHIFIAPIKDRISQDKINEEIAIMQSMKNKISQVVDLKLEKVLVEWA